MSSQRHHGGSYFEWLQDHEQQVMLLVLAKDYEKHMTTALQLTDQRFCSMHASAYIMMMLQDPSMGIPSAWLTYLQLSSLC